MSKKISNEVKYKMLNLGTKNIPATLMVCAQEGGGSWTEDNFTKNVLHMYFM